MVELKSFSEKIIIPEEIFIFLPGLFCSVSPVTPWMYKFLKDRTGPILELVLLNVLINGLDRGAEGPQSNFANKY